MVNIKEFTLFWYINKNKVSHVEEKVNKEIITEMSKNFVEMIVQIGNKFTLLGMEIELTDVGKVRISTKEYIQEAIDISEEDIASCYYLPKGGIMVTFWKKWKGSAFQNVVGKIKTATNSHMNLFFNFMLTQRRSKLLFEIRKLKKAGKIVKF